MTAPSTHSDQSAPDQAEHDGRIHTGERVLVEMGLVGELGHNPCPLAVFDRPRSDAPPLAYLTTDSNF